MVALGTGANANTLYRFSAESPGAVGAVPVTGLGANTLVGIDFRPMTGELFGLGVIGSVTTLFAIDPITGVATQVGFPATVPPIVGATDFAVSIVDATSSPNGGMLFDIGPLGVDVTVHTGFDIDPATGEPFVAAESGDLTGLYRVGLATGAATGAGQIGDDSIDFGSLTIGGPAFVPPPPPPPPPAEPKLEALSVSPKVFVPTKESEAIKPGSKGKPAQGTTVSYVLSAKATVAFRIERRSPGRLVAGKCKPPTKGNRQNKSCSRWVGASSRYSDFTRRGNVGSNSFSFSGRLRHRLTPTPAFPSPPAFIASLPSWVPRPGRRASRSFPTSQRRSASRRTEPGISRPGR